MVLEGLRQLGLDDVEVLTDETAPAELAALLRPLSTRQPTALDGCRRSFGATLGSVPGVGLHFLYPLAHSFG